MKIESENIRIALNDQNSSEHWNHEIMNKRKISQTLSITNDDYIQVVA